VQPKGGVLLVSLEKGRLEGKALVGMPSKKEKGSKREEINRKEKEKS
jgi:hypothetical protein